MGTGPHTGTTELVRHIFRRDRFVLIGWVIALAALPAIVAFSFSDLFPAEADRERFFLSTASAPAYRAMLGPAFGSSIGALSAQRSSILFVLVGIASALTVIRHTRTEEESGRLELLRARMVGPLAPLSAAIAVVFAANVALGLLIALGLMIQGLATPGAVAYGAAVAASGCVFAAVAAVAAQLTQGAGDARGIALAVLALAFVLRVAGDAGGDETPLRWMSWLSPIGWLQHVRAFDDERWWVLVLALFVTACLICAAYTLSSRRDLGSGVLAPRSGAANAPAWLRSPEALAWRLHLRSLLAWVAAFAVYGVVIGSITESAADALRDNPQLADIIERLGGTGAFADLYLAAVMTFLGFVAAAYAIQAALRPRAEEQELHTDAVLATSVGRLRWVSSHVLFATIGPALCLSAAGLVAGLTYGLISGDVLREVPRVFGAALGQLPAVWIMGGLALALFGLWPRCVAISWIVLAVCFFVGEFGAILRLPWWLLDFSPFSHLPALPGGDVAVVPLAVLIAVATLLTAIGLAAFRNRDILA